MNSDMRSPRLEFRIPISPTAGFFAQVRLFAFALRRIGGLYEQARIRIAVGDKCDLDAVRRSNRWSENENVLWDRVPDALFESAGIWGTANWRLNLPVDDADIIILSDADTVLLRDINPILDMFQSDRPIIAGHMAHYPPPVGLLNPAPAGPEFWPEILHAYGAGHIVLQERYSMDVAGSLPLSPPYFNLGFVAMNRSALFGFGHDIHWTEAWLKAHSGSHMRCQLALTLIACRREMDIKCLPASYNMANDVHHFSASGLKQEDVRVLHYLRETELDRSTFLLPGGIDAFLSRPMQLPINTRLQQLVRDYVLHLSDQVV